MNYGMPYKGSKNKIAEKLIAQMPSADYFVDLFGGGGAMTHCAALSGKYKQCIYNELSSVIYKGFKMALNGEFKNEERWISREDFARLKNIDPYVAMCFSFGNDCKTYAYSYKNENYEQAFHNLCFSKTPKEIRENYRKIHKIIKDDNPDGRLFELRSLENLERLQSLESLKRQQETENSACKIQCCNLDYQDVNIPDNSVVYCDIPYKGTNKYNEKFDYKRFYEWALSIDYTVYISSYEMPCEFIEIYSIDKTCSLCATDNAVKSTEKLFVNKLYKEGE